MIATWWGESKHPGWRLVRLPLIPFSVIYGAAAAARRAAHESGWARPLELPVPTISVGNLTVGGTGKTPMVRWLAGHLAATGRRPLVFSSGFGARADASALDEEGASLARALPGVRVLQGRDPDRVLADACRGPDAPGAIVLDDGFQKLGIRKDLDLVMLDASRPFGSGFTVPAGPLREWAGTLRRAHVIVLSRTELVAPEQIPGIVRRIEARAPGIPILRQRHVATTLVRSGRPASELSGAGVYLISAIAHPQAFEAMARRLGARVLGHDAFKDHAPLPRDLVERTLARARAAGADLVLSSAKDAPKLDAFLAATPPVDALDIAVQFEDDPSALLERLEALFGRPVDVAAQHS